MSNRGLDLGPGPGGLDCVGEAAALPCVGEVVGLCCVGEAVGLCCVEVVDAGGARVVGVSTISSGSVVRMVPVGEPELDLSSEPGGQV